MDVISKVQEVNPYGINNPNLYANGTPFLEIEDLDKYILKKAIKEVNGKKPVVIVIGGPQSSAKTTLSVHFADRVNILTGFPLLDLTNENNPQYSQGSKNFMKKLNEARLKGYKIIVWDETASDYRRKRAISNINKILDEAMDMIRRFKMIVILVYHDFSEIPNELIRKKVITCLFQNQDRDIEHNYVSSKLYNYGKMCLIKHNLIKSIIPEYAYSVEPNFAIKFKDLSPERSAQLEKLSSSIKDKIFESAEIRLQGYLTQEELSDKTMMSKAWVRKTLNKFNIIAERRIKKINYYPANTLERLKSKIKRK